MPSRPQIESPIPPAGADSSRRPTLARRARQAAILGALAAMACLSVVCRADTVASLLGNFTINQYCGLRLAENQIEMHYAVVFGQLPALRELNAADANGDGVTTQAERLAYVRRLAPEFTEALKLTVDGVAIPLHATNVTTSLPTEQGGFSLRLDVEFAGALPASARNGNHRLEFANDNYPGRFGWQEIAVMPARSIAVYDTNAFATSLTAGLTEALPAIPASGPLGERAIHLAFVHGSAPAGARLLQPRPGGVPSAGAPLAQAGSEPATPWIERATRRLISLISGANVPPHAALLALLAAALLGALHAFAPGHGKTVVGAYLVGSRGTTRHAAFLGVTVTVTHTLGVFALGFATLLASRYVVPERLLPVLSLASGLLVLGLGVVLLVQRWHGARGAQRRPAPRPRPLPLSAAASATGYRLVARPGTPFGDPALAFVRGHAGGAHAHGDRHDGLRHTHGGVMHSHLPPGAAGDSVSWRSLLTLGISGGLVPCPSAMVLLLAAVALNKTAYGLVLVLAFSAGLAATLTAVGLVFLYARNRLGTLRPDAPWSRWLPIASAGAIVLVGVAMCYGALAL